jgi:hypothetical protein
MPVSVSKVASCTFTGWKILPGRHPKAIPNNACDARVRHITYSLQITELR